MLIGGNKTGDGRFYDRMVPLADDIYSAFLTQLEEEAPPATTSEPEPANQPTKKTKKSKKRK